eukprot:974987_1
MQLLLCLALAISLLVRISSCSGNERFLDTIHEDFVLTCCPFELPDGAIKSMRSVEKIEQNDSTMFKYQFLFITQPAQVSIRVQCHKGLILKHVIMSNSEPSPLMDVKDFTFGFESVKTMDFQLMEFQAQALTKNAVDWGYCEVAMFCDQPPERETHIKGITSWNPNTFSKNVSELRVALHLRNNPNIIEKKLHKRMNFKMLVVAWKLLLESTDPNKYEDAAKIIRLVEKEEMNIERSYVCPVLYFFARLAVRLGMRYCYPNLIHSVPIDESRFADVVVLHLEKNNLSPLRSTNQILKDVTTVEKSRYVDWDEKAYKEMLEFVPTYVGIFRQHVFLDRKSFLEPTSSAFKVYEHDFPIWIMEEETASTLWTSLAKEHIFPKNAMEQIDPRKFNVKLDTEIDYLCEKENCGRHPITLAKLLGSEQSRHFLEQNEHLEKYEAERLQLEKEEALKKQQEAERIRREQEEALKKQQE